MLSAISDVVICDDHYVSAVGVEALLRGYSVKPLQIQKASTGKMALDLIAQKAPDLAIVDLGLPDMSGIDVIKGVRAKSRSTVIIVLTGTTDSNKLNETSRLSVNGLLRKSGTSENLADALMFIKENPDQIFLDPSVKSLLHETPTSSLTKRELEVLEFMMAGLTTEKIAEKMNCATTTVKTYRTRIMNRSGARNSSEMIAWFLKRDRKNDFGSDT